MGMEYKVEDRGKKGSRMGMENVGMTSRQELKGCGAHSRDNNSYN